jgi:hypothetical protein
VIEVTSVPEPSSMLLVSAVMAGFIFRREMKSPLGILRRRL